jgi:hypothetical protein
MEWIKFESSRSQLGSNPPSSLVKEYIDQTLQTLLEANTMPSNPNFSSKIYQDDLKMITPTTPWATR